MADFEFLTPEEAWDMKQDYYYQRTLVQIREMRRLIGDETMIGGGFFGPFTMAAQCWVWKTLWLNCWTERKKK